MLVTELWHVRLTGFGIKIETIRDICAALIETLDGMFSEEIEITQH
jgi:hypothetical protein